ncbi:MAG: EAL domain-containing protein [Xanthobacteraceae bacterium]|jgi:diguanylate cyclase (GGDEF)-like protein/PAS domain S-box-containing protein
MRNEALSQHGATPPNPLEFQAAVRAAQIKALYRAPATMLVNPITASLLAAVLWQAYPAWVLLLWVGLFCVVVGARFVDRARYLRQPHESGHEAAWARRFTVGAAATGLLWGLSASVVFVSPDPVAHVVVTFVLGGMTVGAVFQQSAYLPAFFSFTLPATVPQVVVYLGKGDRVSVAMSLMLAVYVVVVALMGRYINRWIVETVRLRLDQAAANSKLQATVAESKAVLNEIEQIYRYAPVGLCFMDTNHRYARMNEHLAEMSGVTVDAALGRTVREVVPRLADDIIAMHRPIFERGEPVLNAEVQGASPKPPHGERHWLMNCFPLRSESGDIIGVIDAVLDITDLKQTQLALRQSEERFRTIFDSVNDLIFVHDFETVTVVDVNQRVCEMFGYTRDELLGGKIGDLSENEPPYTRPNLLSEVQKARSGTPQTFDWHCKAKDGRLFWVELSIRPARFGGRDFLLTTAREISRRKEAEGQLKRLAQFDLLTGLANRGVFVAEVTRAIERAHRDERTFAVLYLDLDHFKDVNDTLGHPIGDQLLRSVAQRLQANVRTTDTLARFGGDEFALLMTDIGDPTDAGVLADKLLQIMAKPFLLGGNQIQSGVSIGIATYEPDVPEAETLLAHADVALYRAKSEGRHTYRFFTGAMDAEVRKRVALTSELQAGIAAGQLFLLYQPQVDMETSRLVGLEALVRWNHPTRGVILPGEFLPVAERSGLIVNLGNWVLRSACRQAGQWLETGVALPPVAVNVSALQFKAPRELEKEIEAALAETGLPRGSLEIEMTETALMGTSSGHDNVVERLRARGLRIAIDDFGTGYSSLLYLRRFPVDRIKIAQEFVKHIGIEPNDTAIVKAAIGLARELGIGVMAEGVETADQVRLLHEWGCRQAQGFYFAAPMPAEDVLPLLRSGSVMRWLAAASIAPGRPRRLRVVKPRRVHPAPKSGASR